MPLLLRNTERKMYALIEFQGKQYKAEDGALLKVDRVDAEQGADLDLDHVVLVSSDDGVKVGTPYVKGAKVTATVEGHEKGPKLLVRTYKRRKNFRRSYGHRSHYSLLRVKEIQGT